MKSYNKGLIQDNVITETRTSSSVSNFKLNSGFANGLLINAPDGVGASTITARYTPADGSKSIYLFQNTPIKDLERLSDQKGGHDLDATRAIQQLIATGSLVVDNTLSADVLAFGARTFKTNIKIDLGDLVFSGSELDVTINWKWSGGAINRTISISRYEEERRPASLKLYEISKEVSKKYNDVLEMYLLTETPSSDLDVQVKVQDEFNSQDASFEQFHQMALTTGRYNSAPVDVVPVQIYGSVTPIPATVDVNLTGSDTAEVKTLVIKEILLPVEVSNSTIIEAERLAQMLRTMERADAMKARAYRHRLGLPKSQTLEGAVNRLRR